jgi:hypothetical protein
LTEAEVVVLEDVKAFVSPFDIVVESIGVSLLCRPMGQHGHFQLREQFVGAATRVAAENLPSREIDRATIAVT